FHILGGFSFFDHIETGGWRNFKSASFTLPKRAIIKNGATSLSVSVEKYPNCSPEEIHRQVIKELQSAKIDSTPAPSLNPGQQTLTQTSPIDFEEWQKAIQSVRRKINDDDFDKIVLARQLNLSSKNKLDAAATLAYFRKYYPNCCRYLVRGNDTDTFMGCSPERLLAFNEDGFETEALAGSMHRGKTKEQDEYLAYKLLHSNKNREEHQLVIDHITE